MASRCISFQNAWLIDTQGYLVGMAGGLALEIIGYAGRVQLHFNPFPFDPFLEYVDPSSKIR